MQTKLADERGWVQGNKNTWCVFITLYLLFIIHSLIKDLAATHSETGNIPGNLDCKTHYKLWAVWILAGHSSLICGPFAEWSPLAEIFTDTMLLLWNNHEQSTKITYSMTRYEHIPKSGLMGKHAAVLECAFQWESSEATQVQLPTPLEWGPGSQSAGTLSLNEKYFLHWEEEQIRLVLGFFFVCGSVCFVFFFPFLFYFFFFLVSILWSI